MLINDKSAIERLNSPLNLINRLKQTSKQTSTRKNAMSLFIRPKEEVKPVIPSFNPFEQAVAEKSGEQNSSPQLEDLVENSEAQVRLTLAHDSALKLLNDSVKTLSEKLDSVDADKLPSVISAASKVVEGIRRERLELAKTGKDKEVHYHFYTPQQKTINDYSIIDVTGTAAHP